MISATSEILIVEAIYSRVNSWSWEEHAPSLLSLPSSYISNVKSLAAHVWKNITAQNDTMPTALQSSEI